MCECEVDVYLWTRGESLPPDTRDTRSFVKRVKRKGESTQPCGAPVLRITGLERVVDLDRLRPVKKKVESPVADGRMHIQRYKFIKNFTGIIVTLKAELKSTKRILV